MPTNFFRRSAVAIAVAACSPAASQAAGIARVDFAVGNVTAVRPDGRSRALTRGSEIEVGDTVNTQQGRAQLRFQDGAYMSLQPETSFKVDEFRFAEQGGGKDGIVMSLLKGGMRTITGLIGRANRRNYRLRTEVATIGIRGTEYAIRYTNSIEVFCAGGAISVENEGGTLVLGTGQGGFVQDPKREPQRSDERPFLPPTAASGGQEPQEEIAPPVNPVQESRTATLLTGTATYNMAQAFANGDGTYDAANATLVATLDSDGKLVSFDGGQGTIGLGTASVVDVGNDGLIAWGRWVNGLPSGSTVPLTNTEALHYVVGLPTPSADILALQSGDVTATYGVIGATTPTSSAGDLGVLQSGSLTARFGSMTVDVNLGVSTAQDLYTVSGRNIPISGSVFSQSGLPTTSPTTCFSGCSTDISGFFAGAMAQRAGLAYLINDSGLRTYGAAAFAKQ
jgi:hypothetical protein